MKKNNHFNAGDKVFAKVKGYPAWPAKVISITLLLNLVVIMTALFLDHIRKWKEI